jgi:hypothetical protein
MLEMLKNKKVNSKLKKKNVPINMVLIMTTKSQVFESDTFKEKETKLLQTSKKNNNFRNHFRMLLNNYKKKEPPL